jgi:hypothetical protein
MYGERETVRERENEKKNVYRTENGVVWTAAAVAESIINSNKDLCELERRSGFFSFIFRFKNGSDDLRGWERVAKVHI